MCDPATLITGLVSLVGLGTSIAGTSESSAAAQSMNAAMQQELGLQKQQLALEQMQNQRSMLRQAALARSTAITNAQSGAGNVQGSGIQGALGGIQSNFGANWGFNNMGYTLGTGMLSAESNYANAYTQLQLGGALTSLGGGIAGSAPALGRIGSSIYNSSIWNNLSV